MPRWSTKTSRQGGYILPLISIITVVFNGAKNIEKTIKSVIGQSYQSIEYIIIDGGSTDGTLAIIDKYRQDISTLVSEPDDGIYDAMNKGISLANGKIIGIINSDDYYEEHIIAYIVAESRKSLSPGIIYGNMNIINSEGKIVHTLKKSNHEKLIPRMSMWVPHPTVFVSREIYRTIGVYNTEYKISADYEFLVRSYKRGVQFHKINKIISSFQLGGISTSESKKILQRKIIEKIYIYKTYQTSPIILVLRVLGYVLHYLRSKITFASNTKEI